MEDLYGLGMVIGNNFGKCDNLKYYFLPEGMKEVREKMPISFIRKWLNFYCNKHEQGASPCFQEFMSEIINFINVCLTPCSKMLICQLRTQKF